MPLNHGCWQSWEEPLLLDLQLVLTNSGNRFPWWSSWGTGSSMPWLDMSVSRSSRVGVSRLMEKSEQTRLTLQVSWVSISISIWQLSWLIRSRLCMCFACCYTTGQSRAEIIENLLMVTDLKVSILDLYYPEVWHSISCFLKNRRDDYRKDEWLLPNLVRR